MSVLQTVDNENESFLCQSLSGLELKAVLSKVEVLAPLCLAEDWDNVGLLIEPSAPHIVKNVFLCNDLTELVLGKSNYLDFEMINRSIDAGD